MTAWTCARSALVPLDDEAYRAHQAHHARLYRQQNPHRGRLPTASNVVSRIVERGARSLLGDERWLSSRRVLAFQRLEGTAWVQRYKEVDAVATDEDDVAPQLFVEIKSVSTDPIKAWLAARRQLDRIRQIAAGATWSEFRLAGIVVVPAAAELPAPESLSDVVLESVAELAQARWDPERDAVLFLRRPKPWRRAVDRGWVDDPSVLDRLRRVEAGEEVAPRSFSAGDQAAASPLAAAFERASRRGKRR